MLTQERLKESLHYDPETGKWTWRVDRTQKTRAGDEAGRPGKYRYCQIGLDRRPYMAHRLAWFYMTGSWPKEVDHVDRNGHNNAWSNLREATRSQNNANRGARCAAGVKGVRKNARSVNKPYEASITVAGKKTFLGMFKTAEEANAAYFAAAKSYFGDFATAA